MSRTNTARANWRMRRRGQSFRRPVVPLPTPENRAVEVTPDSGLDAFAGFTPANKIDELVLTQLKRARTLPSEACSDAVFVRRVFLDTIGTLPTAGEVREFLADARPDKRGVLIDTLLERDEFAQYWGLKWGDLLRVKSEFPSNLWPNAVQAYDRWIRDSLKTGKPYDQFVRELVTATGSNFRSPPVNFYRAFQVRSPQRIAENVALVFMGLRLDGRSGLTEEQLLGLSAFFAKIGYKKSDEWKEEIIFFDPAGKLIDPKTQRQVLPMTPDGRTWPVEPDKDPRVMFADWLTAPGNPWFARNIVNRIWFWLLGRGIVHEPDDMRASNPAWSPELLEYLETELVSHNYDLKWIYRLILNAHVYQLSAKPQRWDVLDESGFSHYRLRRLDAEVLLDAINQILGTGEVYSSAIPEPFTFLPPDQRAIMLADGSIESVFLTLFGRPSRDTSLEVERTSAPSVLQALHLLNSSYIQEKIEQSPVIRQLIALNPLRTWTGEENPKLVETLYLRILSRFPSDEERSVAMEYLRSPQGDYAESVFDLVWALINGKEFLLKQ